MTLYVPSPIDEGSFSLSILEREKGTERLNVRLVEEWRSLGLPGLSRHREMV